MTIGELIEMLEMLDCKPPAARMVILSESDHEKITKGAEGNNPPAAALLGLAVHVSKYVSRSFLADAQGMPV